MAFPTYFWILAGLDVAVLALLCIFLIGIRAFTRSFGNLPGLFKQLIEGFLWEESVEEAADGKKVVVRKPSKQFLASLEAIVPAVAPVLMKAGSQWVKENVKIGKAGAGGPGLDLANLDPSAFLGMLPKRYQGIAGLLMPFVGKFLGGMGGPATGAAKGAPDAVALGLMK